MQKIQGNAFGFKEHIVALIEAFDAFGVESVGHQAFLQSVEKGLALVFGDCRGLKYADEKYQ
jgi:hypothetical protein